MNFPQYRGRRIRQNKQFRRLVREHHIRKSDLIQPLFVVPGKKIRKPISSMPDQFHLSVDQITEEAQKIEQLGIPGIILFGIPKKKDSAGTWAYHKDGIVQRAVEAIKKVTSSLLVITDVCLCEYTDHGHCGWIEEGQVHNDATLELLANSAISHAAAGADMVAPSDMMDGRVGFIRETLDEEGFEDIPIMSYAVKYSSAFYGPFREAAESAPQFGDRKSYQMDPPNIREAFREAAMDIEEGADIIMVKPALPYLDVISGIRQEFDHPIAAYQVSGEYSMIKAAAAKGWIDEDKVVHESLIAIKRAGADMILTYYAQKLAAKL